MSDRSVEQGSGPRLPAAASAVPVRGRLLRADALGAASCATCVAACCRLTVVLEPGDAIPVQLTARGPAGLPVMAKDPSGWCVALDRHGRCGIYAGRPQACRRFAENGPYCRAVRIEHAAHAAAMVERL